MAKRPTPIERFISEIPSDPRRAYDARQRAQGLHRVNVAVPVGDIETLKTFARFLRNTEPHIRAAWVQDFENYLADTYADFDEACERGEA